MSTPELRAWILQNTEAGHDPAVLLDQLLAAGWKEDIALNALEQTLTERVAELQRKPIPEPDLKDHPIAMNLDGRVLPVLLSIKRPRLVVFSHFLTDEECDALIDAARPRLAPSTVLADATGHDEHHAGRVSEGMFFGRCETPLIQGIEERISQLVNWPIDQGETLQILRYGLGGKYDPHFDYFDPSIPGSAEPLKVAGNRVGTLIMVLQSPSKGGATIFPDAGIEVYPQRGQAIFFSYDRPDPSTHTLHGGAPVVEGEKWIATKWFRERPFPTSAR